MILSKNKNFRKNCQTIWFLVVTFWQTDSWPPGDCQPIVWMVCWWKGRYFLRLYTIASRIRLRTVYIGIADTLTILEICKQFSENLVNESGNVPRRGPVPKFSDLEVVALSLTAETESIDSEKWLFDYKLQEYKDSIPNLISRRQFNDRRKKTAGLCEELRKRIATEMDGGEEN